MSIEDKLTYLNNTKKAIKQAIVNKGVKVSDADTFRSYADKIVSITAGGGTVDDNGDWQPNPNWWDIETIIKNDTRDYAGKYIALIFNVDDTITFNLSSTECVAVATSDGAFYTYEDGTQITHTWNIAEDKPVSDNADEQLCSRYVIYYHNSEKIDCENIKAPIDTVYIVFSCNLTKSSSSGFGNSRWFNSKNFLQSFNFSTGFNFTNVLNFSSFCFNCPSLQKLPDVLDVSQGTDFSSFCFNCYSLQKLPDVLDVSQGTDFSYFCSDCPSLQKLPDVLDVSQGTNFSRFCYGCHPLQKLPDVLDVSQGTDFSSFCFNCHSLQKLPDVLDVSQGTNFSNFCGYCSSLQKLPDVLDVSQGTNFFGFCYYCHPLQKLPDVLDVSQGTDFSSFCFNCYSLQKLPDVLDVSQGTDFSRFCSGCSSLQKLPDVLDVSQGTNFFGFCSGCKTLVQTNIKLSNISITTLNTSGKLLKSSMKYIADNAPDVTDLADSPTLTLGTANIARAGEASGEIIQTLVNKGWTVN